MGKAEKTQPQVEPNSQEPNHLRETLLASSEGRILLVGVAMASAYILWLGVKLWVSPDEFQILTAMTAVDIIWGRVAAMALGVNLHLDHMKVLLICMFIEANLVLIVYPLFVFSWRHLLVIKGLRKVFDRMRRSAEAHKDKVQRYGIIGLFAFVWFPFWMTGPVVGCVIGFLLGLRAWINITVVISGSCLAILVWGLLVRRFHDSVAAYSSQAAMVLMFLLIGIIIIRSLLHRTFRENRNKH